MRVLLVGCLAACCVHLVLPQRSAELQEAILLAVDARYEAALELFKLELARHPQDPVRHYYVGITLFKLGRYEKALDRLQAATEHDAQFPQAYYWLARAFQETGEPERAIAVLGGGLRRFPDNEDLRNLLDLLDPPNQ